MSLPSGIDPRVRRLGRFAIWALVVAYPLWAVVSTPLGPLLLALALPGLALVWLVPRAFRRVAPPPGRVQSAIEDQLLSSDALNYTSHVRVAGAGGLGLVGIAVLMALEFRMVGATMAAGLAGGALMALAVILYRRQHGGLGAGPSDRDARAVIGGSGDDEEPTPRRAPQKPSSFRTPAAAVRRHPA